MTQIRERLEKLREENILEDDQRQVIMPSLILGMLISLLGFLYFITIDIDIKDWFMEDTYMDESIGLIASGIGVIVFLIWMIMAGLVLRRSKPIPLVKYNSTQRRSVRPPIILGLLLSVVITIVFLTSIDNWQEFEWFLQDDFLRESYLFILGLIGIVAYTIWLILLQTKYLVNEG
jgi:DMSO reductase anchor subunit